MAAITLIHDTVGNTLTLWLDDPSRETICEETSDEVIHMKDASGRVIGVEILHYRPDGPESRVRIETVGHSGS
jgi:hypothetical protein